MSRATALVATILLFTASLSLTEQRPMQVSLIQLIATPERFEGKKVSVIGFLELGSESSILYTTLEDRKHGIMMNGIWLDRDELVRRDISRLNLKYVQLIGVFRTHLANAGFLSGGMTAISSSVLWSDPDHPRIEREREVQKLNSPK